MRHQSLRNAFYPLNLTIPKALSKHAAANPNLLLKSALIAELCPHADLPSDDPDSLQVRVKSVDVAPVDVAAVVGPVPVAETDVQVPDVVA